MRLTDKRFGELSSTLCVICFLISIILTSCNNRHDLTDNYSVFTYGEGLYGESEKDYPIFASKLGYEGEPPFISNVRQVWWNESSIVIEQDNNSWWIITAKDKKLTAGDTFHGPLSILQKDSLVKADNIIINKMKHQKYERK